MQKKWDVYVYGDVNIDLVVPGVESLPPFGSEVDVPVMETFVGGGAALFTLGLAKLGMTPVFQGSIGKDMYGAYIRGLFRELGVDDSLLLDSDTQKTGISISCTNEGLSLKYMDLSKVPYAKHVHVTGYAGRSNHEEYLDVLKRIRAMGDVTVSFDVGWDTTEEWYEGIFDLLPMIDVLFMNETECQHYTRCEDIEAGARRLAEKAGMAVIKLGKRGALAVKDGEVFAAPTYKVNVVDTTGAGDSFNAGFVYGFVSGLPVGECLKRGNTGFPFRDRLESWIATAETEA